MASESIEHGRQAFKRREAVVRASIRTALAAVVRPLTGMLEHEEAFKVVREELDALEAWFKAAHDKAKEQKA